MVHRADLDSQVGQLSRQNTALQAEITDRQREIAEAQSVSWLIEEARKLGYVRPGEKVFVLSTPGAQVPALGGVDAKLPTFDPSPSPSPTLVAPGAPPAITPAPSPTAGIIELPSAPPRP